MVRWTIALLTACFCLTALAQRKIESNGFHYTVQPIPAWVSSPPAAPSTLWKGSSSTRYLLVDSQVNLLSQAPQRFTRFRVTARDQAGLSDMANVRIEFNPAYESLTLHEVGVTRNGVRRNKLAGAKFHLLQRETQLDKNIYGGLVTALLVVDDVRLDDVIDVSYSVSGANPVFNGKYASVFPLNWFVPTDVRRVRVEYPVERTLNYKVVGSDAKPSVTTKGRNFVLEVTTSAQPPVVPEDRFVPWAQLLPELQLSEYASWRDVEGWALEHYQVPRDLSPELLKVANTIRSQAMTPTERAARVLKLVQDDIRYFAISTGVSSHKPSPPEVTYARRYGDCKDKTLLTIALLHQLGIEAHPTLVSASRQRQVRDWLPMPDAFDHVITEAVIDGHNYWLDATKIHQASELSHLSFDPYGYGLVVGGGTGELSQVTPPSGYGEKLDVTERFSVKRYADPAELTLITHATTGYADRMRSYLASKGPEIVAQEFEDATKQKYPSAKRMRDIAIADDLERDELTITEQYEVRDLFKYANGMVTSAALYPTSFLNTVRPPEKVGRTLPMQLPFAATLKHQFELDLPLDIPLGTAQPVNINNPHFAFSYRSSVQQRHFAMQYELRLLRDQVIPKEMSAYLEAMTQVRRQFDRQLRLPLFNADTLRREFVATANGQRWPRSQSEWLRGFLMASLSRRMASEAAIRSGQLEGKDLATAWLEVAIERSNSSDREKALEAIDMSLKADTNLPRAYKTRAEVMAYAGDFKSALPEMNRALSLDKEIGTLSLGQIQYYLGQHQDAARSFIEEVQRTSGQEQLYRYIWLYLAAKRSGLDPAEAMQRYGYSEQRQWPGPIASFLMGALTEEALLEGAKGAPNAGDVPPRLCEAWFFIAQKNLLTGNVDYGRQALLQAIDTKVEPYVEYRFSKIELERLPN